MSIVGKIIDEMEYELDPEEVAKRILKEIERCIPEGKPQIISKSRLQYDMGWCDGRNKLRDEIKTKLKTLFKEEE